MVVIPLIQERFSAFSSELFKSMTWLDPQFWIDDRDYGKDFISTFLNEFKTPLLAAGLDERKVFSEWKALKITVNSHYKNVDASKVWEKMLIHKKLEFPNMLLLIELAMCLSSSNSAVERVFSLLTIMLSDRRLRMSHDTMEDMIIIAGNSRLWSHTEKENILTRATDMYMQKRRYTEMESEPNNVVHNIEDDEDVAQNETGASDESDDDESHSDMSFQESSMDDSDISD